MSTPLKTPAGTEAIEAKGWLRAHQWLLLRRSSQLLVLLLFLAGPWFGLWLVKGNLNYSKTLDVLPLTDPFILLQSLVTGKFPATEALLGAAIVLVFYALVGGRAYCSWVCPINPVTDLANWLRDKLGVKGSAHISRRTRYWILGMTLALALTTGTLAWEMVNPVSMLHRGLIFGLGFAWTTTLAIFLFDLFVMRRGWCGHLCPMGAFYSLLGRFSRLRVELPRRGDCNDCMDCFTVCPEQQVIRPALKGIQGTPPVILESHCTNCGRCIDVCAKEVFRLGFYSGPPVVSSSPPGAAQK